MLFTLFWGAVILIIASLVLFVVGLGFIIYGVIAYYRKRKTEPDSLNEELVTYENENVKQARKNPAVKSIIIGAILCLPLLSMVPSTIIQEIEKIPDKQTVAYYLNPNNDDYDKASLLLEQGADPNKELYSWTPLTHVCYYGEERDEQMTALLLEHGADPNLANFYGETPLSIAIYRGENETIVRLLLEYGADPNKISSYGGTPLQTAINEKNEAIINLLIEYGAK